MFLIKMTHITSKPLHRGPTLKFLRKFFKTWTFGLKNIILYAKFEKYKDISSMQKMLGIARQNFI